MASAVTLLDESNTASTSTTKLAVAVNSDTAVIVTEASTTAFDDAVIKAEPLRAALTKESVFGDVYNELLALTLAFTSWIILAVAVKLD